MNYSTLLHAQRRLRPRTRRSSTRPTRTSSTRPLILVADPDAVGPRRGRRLRAAHDRRPATRTRRRTRCCCTWRSATTRSRTSPPRSRRARSARASAQPGARPRARTPTSNPYFGHPADPVATRSTARRSWSGTAARRPRRRTNTPTAARARDPHSTRAARRPRALQKSRVPAPERHASSTSAARALLRERVHGERAVGLRDDGLNRLGRGSGPTGPGRPGVAGSAGRQNRLGGKRLHSCPGSAPQCCELRVSEHSQSHCPALLSSCNNRAGRCRKQGRQKPGWVRGSGPSVTGCRPECAEFNTTSPANAAHVPVQKGVCSVMDACEPERATPLQEPGGVQRYRCAARKGVAKSGHEHHPLTQPLLQLSSPSRVCSLSSPSPPFAVVRTQPLFCALSAGSRRLRRSQAGFSIDPAPAA